MFKSDIGLVLEGGGMRGVYTAGVLEYFLEQGVSFPYVIGVSAGACNAASYLSKQKGRNKRVNIDFITDPRYLSWRNFFEKREFFGMDFIFDEIPNKLVPFDYDTFYNNPTEFVVGTTDCHTGEPVYYNKKEYGQDILSVLKASSSLPFASQEIFFKDRILLDGGISDSIPIQKAKKDGYKKNLVILTRNEGYMKKPSRFSFLIKRKYRHYQGLQKALINRYQMYNDTIKQVLEDQEKGNTIIIRPTQPIKVGRMERDQKKLEHLFNEGYMDASRMVEKVARF